ncbi:MAG: 2OG-Fe(II) oxygenase [Verrucomicrobia bacterium]|nr:MAG: 2OG-Fe(II) oxygenase [Verrucomicrobiota bacterium]
MSRQCDTRAGGFLSAEDHETMKRAAADFELHVIEKFFDRSICRHLVEEIRRAETRAALTYGKGVSGLVEERTRNVSRATVSSASMTEVMTRLVEYLPRLRDYFGVPVSSIEEPQFLWYGPGDFFVAHQDGNTKLIQLESDRLRRISLSVFLNQQADSESPDCYSGGSLVFSDRLRGERRVIRGETGKLVAFRSELTHEITPIENGDRFAIVTWCRIVG